MKDSDSQQEELRKQVGNSLRGISRVLVDGNHYLSFSLCPECNPNLQDKIIAKSTRNGIKIHDLECAGLKTVSFDSLLEAHRENNDPTIYHLILKMRLKSDEITILDMIQTFAQFNVPLVEMSVHSHQNKQLTVSFTLMFQNPAKIDFLLKDLKKYGSSIVLLRRKLF